MAGALIYSKVMFMLFYLFIFSFHLACEIHRATRVWRRKKKKIRQYKK